MDKTLADLEQRWAAPTPFRSTDFQVQGPRSYQVTTSAEAARVIADFASTPAGPERAARPF